VEPGQLHLSAATPPCASSPITKLPGAMGPTARRRHCHAVACTNPYCPPRVHGKEDKVDFGNNTRLYSAGCTRWAGRGHPPGRDIWRRCNLGQRKHGEQSGNLSIQLSRAACVEPSCWHCAVGAFLRLGCFWLDTRRAKGHVDSVGSISRSQAESVQSSGSRPSHLVWLPTTSQFGPQATRGPLCAAL
jgi:hypothetical protein